MTIQYRSRSEIVEAWHYTGDNADELHKIFGRMKRDLPMGQIGVYDAGSSAYHSVEIGNWIVRRVIRQAHGAGLLLQICTPGIFAATYEPVTVDYRALLVRYMAHVGEIKGDMFLDNDTAEAGSTSFTAEELTALRQIKDDAIEAYWPGGAWKAQGGK